jgi:hypothetical protein
MTTYRYKWERYLGWYGALAVPASILGIGAEFYFSQPQFRHPSPGRTERFISHGVDCWVSPLIWWIHKIGIIAFVSIFVVILIDKAARAFVDGWNS